MSETINARVQSGFDQRIKDNALMRRARASRQAGLFPYNKPQKPASLNEAAVDGEVLLQLGSSNYLGLAQDPRVQEAVIDAVRANGTSCTSSRLLSGTRPLHHELEEELADFFGKEAAVAFTTGYLANIGTIPALVGRHDLAVYDAEVHACIIDGMRLSGADCLKFSHNDADDLDRQLGRREAERKLIIIDSIYSMNGDVAPLREIIPVAERHHAWIFLDDAHGAGVLGPGGRGLAHQMGVENNVPIIMGVFSKAFASTGGFVAGSSDLVDFLRLSARSYVFSNAIAPAQAAATLAALRILKQEPERARRAIENAAKARTMLRQQGWTCTGDGTHMLSVFIGDDDLALKAAKTLIRHGVWVSPAVSPAVPFGKAVLRTNFPPTLTEKQFGFAMDAFEKARRDLFGSVAG